MTRVYFKKTGFETFHKALVFKRELRTKFNIYCKQIEKNENGTYEINVTSVKENSQNLLRNYGFEEIKAEAI